MKKEIHLYAFILLILITQENFSQEKIFSGYASNNSDNSAYTAMKNIWYANEQISYLAPSPFIINRIKSNIPLRQGEGKNRKYVMEGSILSQIPIFMGRSGGNHFWQTSRLTFDFGFNLRMAADSSNPLLPNNNIFGITYNKKIFNSATKNVTHSLQYAFDNWYNKNESMKDLSLDISAHHYSNGQQPGFFLYDTVNTKPLKRNDYKKGDFSTNYIRLGLTYSYLTKKRSLMSASLVYQLDGSFIGPLNFSPEQKNSYGNHRIKNHIQYRFLHKRKYSDNTIAKNVCDSTQIIKSINKFEEFIVRLENECILGNLSNYNMSTKYRFSQHLYLQYTRPNWRALGVVLHFYHGRDYSNIRFDMPIITAMIGMSFNFNKYFPALSDHAKFQK